MELKTFIFSILLGGTTIAKTIIYNDEEYIAIEKYSILTESLDGDSTSFVNYVYCLAGAENLIELHDGEFMITPCELRSGGWEMVGEQKLNWITEVEQIDIQRIRISKTATSLEEKNILKMTTVNLQLFKTIPQIINHKGALYVTVESTTYSKGREIFRVELTNDRDADKDEIKLFNNYKEILKNGALKQKKQGDN